MNTPATAGERTTGANTTATFIPSLSAREEIRRIADIADVVASEGATVRGNRSTAPWRPESKSLSISINRRLGVFYDFVENKGGSQFDFVMRAHGCDFREALAFLADRYGVELKTESPAERLAYLKRGDSAAAAAAYLVDWLTALAAHLRAVRNFIYDECHALDRWATAQGEFTDDPKWDQVARVPERRRIAEGFDDYISKLDENLSPSALASLRSRLEGVPNVAG